MIREIAILRYLLSAWVFYHHLAGFSYLFQSAEKSNWFVVAHYVVYKTGSFAVPAFFVLSGFVVSMSLQKRSEIGSKPFSLSKEFYKSRMVGLYPPYLVALLLVFIEAKADRTYLIWHILGLSAFLDDYCTLNCPAWSLSAEFFFYLIAPVLFFGIRKLDYKGQLLSLISTIIAIFAISIYIFFEVEKFDYYLYHFPPFLILNFIIGMLFHSVSQHFPKNKPLPIAKLLIVMILIWTTSIFPFTIIQNQKLYDFLILGTWIFAPTIIVIALIVCLGKPVTSRSDMLFFKLGDASYLIYILQWPFLGIVRNALPYLENYMIFNLGFLGIFALYTLFAIIVNEQLLKAFVKRRSNAKTGIMRDHNQLSRKKTLSLPALFIALGFCIASVYFPNRYSPRNLGINSELSARVVSTQPKLVIEVENVDDDSSKVQVCLLTHNFGGLKTDSDSTRPRLARFPDDFLIAPRTSVEVEWPYDELKPFLSTIPRENLLLKCF